MFPDFGNLVITSNEDNCKVSYATSSSSGNVLKFNSDGTYSVNGEYESEDDGYYIFKCFSQADVRYLIGGDGKKELYYNPETGKIERIYTIDDTDYTDEFTATPTPSELEKYVLGDDLNGRDGLALVNISNDGSYTFINEESTINDAETSIIYKGGYVSKTEKNDDGNQIMYEIFIVEYKSFLYEFEVAITMDEDGATQGVNTIGDYGIILVYDETQNSNVGKYVSYDGKIWRIIYDDNVVGTQMVCTTSFKYSDDNDDDDEDDGLIIGFGDQTIDINDVADVNNDGEISETDEAIYSYNNAISTLNSVCQSKVTMLAGKVESVRSVGSNPFDCNYENSSLYSSDFLQNNPSGDDTGKYNVKGKIGDSNAKGDFERMSMLGINVSNIWLASRMVCANYFDAGTVFCVKKIDGDIGNNVVFMNGIWGVKADCGYCGNSAYNLLPVVKLSTGALNGLSGSGTESDPYVLQ